MPTARSDFHLQLCSTEQLRTCALSSTLLVKCLILCNVFNPLYHLSTGKAVSEQNRHILCGNRQKQCSAKVCMEAGGKKVESEN